MGKKKKSSSLVPGISDFTKNVSKGAKKSSKGSSGGGKSSGGSTSIGGRHGSYGPGVIAGDGGSKGGGGGGHKKKGLSTAASSVTDVAKDVKKGLKHQRKQKKKTLRKIHRATKSAEAATQLIEKHKNDPAFFKRYAKEQHRQDLFGHEAVPNIPGLFNLHKTDAERTYLKGGRVATILGRDHVPEALRGKDIRKTPTRVIREVQVNSLDKQIKATNKALESEPNQRVRTNLENQKAQLVKERDRLSKTQQNIQFQDFAKEYNRKVASGKLSDKQRAVLDAKMAGLVAGLAGADIQSEKSKDKYKDAKKAAKKLARQEATFKDATKWEDLSAAGVDYRVTRIGNTPISRNLNRRARQLEHYKSDPVSAVRQVYNEYNSQGKLATGPITVQIKDPVTGKWHTQKITGDPTDLQLTLSGVAKAFIPGNAPATAGADLPGVPSSSTVIRGREGGDVWKAAGFVAPLPIGLGLTYGASKILPRVLKVAEESRIGKAALAGDKALARDLRLDKAGAKLKAFGDRIDNITIAGRAGLKDRREALARIEKAADEGKASTADVWKAREVSGVSERGTRLRDLRVPGTRTVARGVTKLGLRAEKYIPKAFRSERTQQVAADLKKLDDPFSVAEHAVRVGEGIKGVSKISAKAITSPVGQYVVGAGAIGLTQDPKEESAAAMDVVKSLANLTGDVLSGAVTDPGEVPGDAAAILEGFGRSLQYIAEHPSEDIKGLLEVGSGVVIAPLYLTHQALMKGVFTTLEDLGKTFGEDFKYRWEPAINGDWETFDERTAENPWWNVLDIWGVMTAGSWAAKGISVRTSRLAGAVGGESSFGRAGRATDEFLSRDRPGLAFSEGAERGIAPQDLSNRLFKTFKERGLDYARQKYTERSLRRLKVDRKGAFEKSKVIHPDLHMKNVRDKKVVLPLGVSAHRLPVIGKHLAGDNRLRIRLAKRTYGQREMRHNQLMRDVIIPFRNLLYGRRAHKGLPGMRGINGFNANERDILPFMAQLIGRHLTDAELERLPAGERQAAEMVPMQRNLDDVAERELAAQAIGRDLKLYRDYIIQNRAEFFGPDIHSKEFQKEIMQYDKVIENLEKKPEIYLHESIKPKLEEFYRLRTMMELHDPLLQAETAAGALFKAQFDLMRVRNNPERVRLQKRVNELQKQIDEITDVYGPWRDPNDPKLYSKTAKDFAETQWFHGSPYTHLTKENVTGLETRLSGRLGPGLYLTNDASIARIYADDGSPYTAGGTPTIYGIRVAPRRILEADKKAGKIPMQVTKKFLADLAADTKAGEQLRNAIFGIDRDTIQYIINNNKLDIAEYNQLADEYNRVSTREYYDNLSSKTALGTDAEYLAIKDRTSNYLDYKRELGAMTVREKNAILDRQNDLDKAYGARLDNLKETARTAGKREDRDARWFDVAAHKIETTDQEFSKISLDKEGLYESLHHRLRNWIESRFDYAFLRDGYNIADNFTNREWIGVWKSLASSIDNLSGLLPELTPRQYSAGNYFYQGITDRMIKRGYDGIWEKGGQGGGKVNQHLILFDPNAIVEKNPIHTMHINNNADVQAANIRDLKRQQEAVTDKIAELDKQDAIFGDQMYVNDVKQDIARLNAIAREHGLGKAMYWRDIPLDKLPLESNKGLNIGRSIQLADPEKNTYLLRHNALRDLDPKRQVIDMLGRAYRIKDFHMLIDVIRGSGLTGENVVKFLRQNDIELPDSLRTKKGKVSAVNTRSKLVSAMRASGANPDDYVLINTTRLDELLTRIGEGHNGVLTEKDSLKKAFESQANFMEAVLKDAQKDGVGGKWVAIHNKDWEQVNYHIVEASKRSRMAKALFDMPKAFASRILLAPNISWQQFQIYANASLAAVAGTGPRAWLEAVRKYKSWDKDTRAAFDWATGVQTHALDIATMDKYLYDFYHKTLTKIPGYQRFLEGRNFLDMFFYIDAKNNQFFRRAVLYNEVKKEAYKRMAKSGASIMEIYKEKMKDTAGLESGITLQQQMNNIINDPKTMDLLASHMEDFLGDYLNFSVMERRVFQRSVMFYGFLRHSLQFTLWNLPVKHPVRTSILAMLSAAAVEDAKATLGADDLDVRQLGVFYLKGPVKIPGLGTVTPGPSGLTEINLSRASITGNMLLEALASDNPIVQGSNLVPIFNNPIWRPWIEAAIGESLYKGTPIRGNVPGEDLGDPNFKWTLGGSLGLWGSAQYVSKQYLNLIRPYRILSQAMQQYPSWRESDLSNPVFGNEYPYKYSQSPQADAYKQAIKDREAFLQNKEGGLFGSTPFAGELFPFFPQPSDTPELLQFQAQQEQLQKEADKRLKAPIEGTPWWQVGDITKDIHKRSKARKLGSFSFFGN